MPSQTKAEVLKMLESRYKVIFTPVIGKKVFFDTNMKGSRSILVCSPQSRTHNGGQGWIDLTKIQIDLMDEYDAALFAFRLPRHQTVYVNLQELRPLLTKDCIFVNQREGVHWKLYLWPERIEVRKNDRTLRITSNTLKNIDTIFMI